MKNFYISMDVEPDLHSEKYESLKYISKFLILLKKYNIKATFFVTCDCIKKNPKIFLEIKKQGHELALHSYDHKRFDNRSFNEKKQDIEKSLACFKKYLNISPLGFRAPQHSVDRETIELLKEKGFKYDSSLMPFNFYHILIFWKTKIKFFHNFTPRKPYFWKGLLELPLSSFILPFSALTLRLLPKKFLKFYLSFISFSENPVFLMHSWDLIEMKNSKLYNLCPLETFLDRLEFTFKYFSERSSPSTLKILSNSF